MATGLVGQHQITTFTSPVNGQTPIDANVVRGNDNTIKTSYDAHDNDATIHVQSSTLAARPAASTDGQKWMTSDAYRIYYDDGSTWHEAAYLPTAGGTIAGNVTITGTLEVDGNFSVNTNKFTVAASSGNTVVAGTLVSTGAVTAGTAAGTVNTFVSGIRITGTPGSPTNGTIFKDATTGLEIRGITGSVNDVSLVNPGGTTTILRVPTGTANVVLGGALTIATGLTVSAGTTSVQALTATTLGLTTLTVTNLTINTVAYVWPGSNGAANTVLTNDGAGNLSWALPAAGSLSGATLASGVTTSSLLRVGDRLGIGRASNAAFNLILGGSVTSGADQTAIGFTSTFGTDGTSSMVAVDALITSAAGSYTTTQAISLHVNNPSKGASHTITTNYGLKIENQTAGTTNYAIKTLGGKIAFVGLPTSAAGLSTGDLWSNSGVVTVA